MNYVRGIGTCLLAVFYKSKTESGHFKSEVTKIQSKLLMQKWNSLAHNNDHSQILLSASPLTGIILNAFQMLTDLILITIL